LGDSRQRCLLHHQVALTVPIVTSQDIAVVPLLVLLPLVSNAGDGGGGDIMATLVPTFLKAGLGLGLLLYGGRTVLRRLFEIVSESKSPEAFISLCLLTVTGTSVITTQLGLSSTLGAFMAGALYSHPRQALSISLSLFLSLCGSAAKDVRLQANTVPHVVGYPSRKPRNEMEVLDCKGGSTPSVITRLADCLCC
jgi:Kef-type K+ transport system membrane component KefB